MPRRPAPDPVRHVPDDERRARLGVRHRLAPSAHATTPEEAAAGVVALHATEPASVHLSVWARMPEIDVAAIDGAFFADRTLVKQMCMRQTLFGLPADLLSAALGSICVRIADRARKDLIKGAEKAGVTDDGSAWVGRAGEAIVAELAKGEALTAKQVRERVPESAGSYAQGAGTKWASSVSLTPRVITLLGLEGRIMRAGNDGDWRASRPRWTTTEQWLGPVERMSETEGYSELVRCWLMRNGPGTVDDIAWWLGSTKGAVTTALDALDAVPVSLDNLDIPGWLLPDDVEPVAAPEPWVALLPLLDPSIMGWRDRSFLLGPHAPELFDSAGNAGTTILVDGRVVGVWVQDENQRVRLVWLEDVPAARRRELEAAAGRLTDWLGGLRVFSVYPSRAMRGD